jgi:hypothetical protein
MNPNARRLDRILTDTPLAASLLARLAAGRRAARAIAPVCAEVVPDFDPLRPGACDLRGGILRIWLGSSAHSTKLRQALPRMQAALRGNSLEVNEIKIGIQPARLRKAPLADAPNKARERLNERSGLRQSPQEIQRIREFTRKLALALPESELRRAVARLERSALAQLARMRESDQPFEKQQGEERHRHGQAADEQAAREPEPLRPAGDEIGDDAGHDDRAEQEQQEAEHRASRADRPLR